MIASALTLFALAGLVLAQLELRRQRKRLDALERAHARLWMRVRKKDR